MSETCECSQAVLFILGMLEDGGGDFSGLCGHPGQVKAVLSVTTPAKSA